MRPRSDDPQPEPDGGHLSAKLSGIRPIAHDEDERQSTADRSTYHSPLQSIFEPVPLPRWLKPRRSKKRF